MVDLDALRKRVEEKGASTKKGAPGVGRVGILGEGYHALSEVNEVIPTGLEALDRHILGCGGWPTGRISEVYGAEGIGKSSLLALGFGQAQKMGGAGILIDTERSISRDWMENHGCDVSKLLVIEPDTLEECMKGMETVLREIPDGEGPILMGWDSLAAGTFRAELEGEAGDFHVGSRARLLNQTFRVLGSLLVKKRTHLLIVNQIREKIGVMFGDPTTTPGGMALKHAASIRLRMLGGSKEKQGDEVVAKRVKMRADKIRFTRPYQEAEFRLYFDHRGWDDEWATVNHAKDVGALGSRERGHEKARVALGWASKSADARPVGAADRSSKAMETETPPSRSKSGQAAKTATGPGLKGGSRSGKSSAKGTKKAGSGSTGRGDSPNGDSGADVKSAPSPESSSYESTEESSGEQHPDDVPGGRTSR